MPSDSAENLAVSLALGGLAFVVTLVLARPVIVAFRFRSIRRILKSFPTEDFSPSHGESVRSRRIPLSEIDKRIGIPSLGGAILLMPIVIVTLVFNVVGRYAMLFPVGVALAISAMEMIAQRIELLRSQKSEEALESELFTFARLLVLSIAISGVLYFPSPWGFGLHAINIPFGGHHGIGVFYLPFATMSILVTMKVVSLVDGLDGVAANLSSTAFVAYGIIAERQGQLGLVTFCFTVVGSLMGLLWFNSYPAQVFLGQSGGFLIGGLLAVTALMSEQWLLLPIIGGVFVANAVPAIVQPVYFRITRMVTGEGRRLFSMSPLYLHYSKLDVPETLTASRFCILGIVFGLLGVGLALL